VELVACNFPPTFRDEKAQPGPRGSPSRVACTELAQLKPQLGHLISLDVPILMAFDRFVHHTTKIISHQQLKMDRSSQKDAS
jgi:hypothetical protein